MNPTFIVPGLATKLLSILIVLYVVCFIFYHGYTPLNIYTYFWGLCIPVSYILLRNYCRFLNIMNPAEANESLYAATEEDDLPKLNKAIDAGADTEYKSPKELRDKEGHIIWGSGKNTSLHVACLRGFMPTVLRLLEINARANATNEVSFVVYIPYINIIN